MLKKMVAFCASLLLVLTFSGCANNKPQTEVNNERINSESTILIAYFSWSGHTKQLAEVIYEQVGGDLFEIKPQIPYTNDINVLSGQAQQELRDNIRPELATHVENFSNYDIIFIGYPNWWSNAPMPVFTFLEEYDFSGKIVIPFTVYGSSGFGNSINSVKNTLPSSTILDGFSVQEHAMENVAVQVSEWLKNLGFFE